MSANVNPKTIKHAGANLKKEDATSPDNETIAETISSGCMSYYISDIKRKNDTSGVHDNFQTVFSDNDIADF